MSFWGSVGYITPVSKTFPVSSITANLQPVLYAGSNPKTVNPFKGAPSNNCFAFFPNTSIACLSAFSVKSVLISLSTDGSINLLKLSSIVSLSICSNLSFFIILRSIKLSILSTGFSILTFKNSSFSPLFIANILWLGIVLIFSLKSLYMLYVGFSSLAFFVTIKPSL